MKRWLIVASGPSAAGVYLGVNCNLLTVNNSWQLAPSADVHYAGDQWWWQEYGDDCKAEGRLWCGDKKTANERGIGFVERVKRNALLPAPYVSCGGNSGHQAINLAFHYGAKEIALVGYDMGDGGHWHEEHDGLSAPENHIRVWRKNMRELSRSIKSYGIVVWNCSMESALDCFPKRELADLCW